MLDQPQHDVIVLGGGLAGLTLAIQLLQTTPSLRVLVLERRKHPVPAATHKVGESTVEIGANYLDTVLRLKEHLGQAQLKKFGFRFFFSEGRSDIDQVLELGASSYLPTPAYQLDRGILENHLARRAQQLGARFVDGALVRTLNPGSAGAAHSVFYEADGQTHETCARWLVDASGRAGLLKRKLDLVKPNAHDANAVWFRIGERIDIDDWSNDAAWLARCNPPKRWLSTNHLCGRGYWVWLIPLASGSHSVGIVCDARMHPLDTMNSFDKALDWLNRHEPRLGEEIGKRSHLLQDFLFLRNFSYSAKQVFAGADRWALTGEAGVFLDPFYSPGTDFIAISNTYVADLIERDLRGEHVGGRSHVYEQLYMSFYDSTLTLYQDQYALFGDPEVLPVKVIWDYTYYWGVLSQLFFQRRLTDLVSISRLSTQLLHTRDLNAAMQPLLREWSNHSLRRNPATMFDQSALPWFAELNRSLLDTLDEDGFRRRIVEYTTVLDELAQEIITRACAHCPSLDVSAVQRLLPPDVSTAGGRLFS